MADVSGTQLSEGTMVKEFSTSVRAGVCVCVCAFSNIHTYMVVEGSFAPFVVPSRPEFTSHRCHDRSSQLSSGPRTSYSILSRGGPIHPSIYRPRLSHVTLRCGTRSDSLVTYRIASRNSTEHTYINYVHVSDYNSGVCLIPRSVVR